jgi:hypothetical protein
MALSKETPLSLSPWVDFGGHRAIFPLRGIYYPRLDQEEVAEEERQINWDAGDPVVLAGGKFSLF